MSAAKGHRKSSLYQTTSYLEHITRKHLTQEFLLSETRKSSIPPQSTKTGMEQRLQSEKVTLQRQLESRMKQARERYWRKRKPRGKMVVQLANNILQRQDTENTMMLRPESSYHTQSFKDGASMRPLALPRYIHEDVTNGVKPKQMSKSDIDLGSLSLNT